MFKSLSATCVGSVVLRTKVTLVIANAFIELAKVACHCKYSVVAAVPMLLMSLRLLSVGACIE